MMQDHLSLATLRNGRAIELDAIPMLAFEDFECAVLAGVEAGQRVAALFGLA
jgi:hypothetical protein